MNLLDTNILWIVLIVAGCYLFAYIIKKSTGKSIGEHFADSNFDYDSDSDDSDD